MLGELHFATRGADRSLLAAEGCPAIPAIVTAVHDRKPRRREALAHAALLSGMALANSGLVQRTAWGRARRLCAYTAWIGLCRDVTDGACTNRPHCERVMAEWPGWCGMMPGPVTPRRPTHS